VRIELTRRGDYAVRAMVALSEPEAGQMTGAVLARATGIPPSFLAQVMGDLVRAELVVNRRGRRGGYRLARPASDISLLAVVEAVEGDGRRTTCVLRGGPCRADGQCDVHAAFFRAQEALFGALASVFLDEVSRGPTTTGPGSPLADPDEPRLRYAARMSGTELP
jgi:Rrf2 family protein